MAMALPTVPGYSTHLGTRNGLMFVCLLDSLTLCNALCQWDGYMGTRTVHRADPVLVPGTIYRRRTVSSDHQAPGYENRCESKRAKLK